MRKRDTKQTRDQPKMAASLSPALIDLLTHMYVSIIDESAG